MNMIEAAALDAIRAYYAEHGPKRDRYDRVRSCPCTACRKARTFAGLIGVDLDKDDEA